ncbi:hypothetical protein G9F72_002775 [Clostridium estertheticum]|uniref:Nmad3 family putative nucleotide modification protein n=1 Tax=Clostridium estertheticum TaxID=238834 RepID=UPI0013E973EB|nr:hypothetical protein [Clostridium estertheticum]MBZ9685273.1 hypothetical protein [Clostridium estertheticum]
MKIILSRKGFDSKAGGIASPIMPDGFLLSMPIPSIDGVAYSNLQYNDVNYSKILEDLGHKGCKGNCHVDPDIRPDIRSNVIREWKSAFGQTDTAQGYLHSAGVEKDYLFLFFGWFRRVELKDGKFKYVSKSVKDFYLGNAMQIVFAYLQIGEIITNPTRIKKYSWHPHADKSRLYNNTNAHYIPRETLSFDDKLPGYGTLDFDNKLVLTKKGCTSAIWNEHPFLMPNMVIGKRKNSAKEKGLYYQGQWQELVLKESEEAMKWALQIIS